MNSRSTKRPPGSLFSGMFVIRDPSFWFIRRHMWNQDRYLSVPLRWVSRKLIGAHGGEAKRRLGRSRCDRGWVSPSHEGRGVLKSEGGCPRVWKSQNTCVASCAMIHWPTERHATFTRHLQRTQKTLRITYKPIFERHYFLLLEPFLPNHIFKRA